MCVQFGLEEFRHVSLECDELTYVEHSLAHWESICRR